MWSSYSASITQTLSDIPNGTYGMTLQGYYREGSADDVKDWDGNSLFAYDLYKDGKENHYATYFANTTTAPMISIFEGAKDAYEKGYEYNAKMTDPDFLDPIESGKWVPNSTDQASWALFHGAY